MLQDLGLATHVTSVVEDRVWTQLETVAGGIRPSRHSYICRGEFASLLRVRQTPASHSERVLGREHKVSY